MSSSVTHGWFHTFLSLHHPWVKSLVNIRVHEYSKFRIDKSKSRLWKWNSLVSEVKIWQINILSLKQIVYIFLLKFPQFFHSKFLQQVRHFWLLTKLIMIGTIWLVESHLKFVMRRLMNYSWVRMFTSDLTHGWWRERNVSESTVGYRRCIYIYMYMYTKGIDCFLLIRYFD
jgi:hypothetical protein